MIGAEAGSSPVEGTENHAAGFTEWRRCRRSTLEADF